MNKVNYASFWERLLSRLLDMSIYFMIIFIPFVKLTETNDFNLILDSLLNFALFVLFVAVIILPFEIVVLSKFGGTLGKLLIGLRIQKENGKYLTYKESFLRLTLGKAVSGLFFSMGYMWIFRNKKRRTWHDIVSDAIVVRKISYGWLFGLLILFVFTAINIGLFYGSILSLLANFNFWQAII